MTCRFDFDVVRNYYKPFQQNLVTYAGLESSQMITYQVCTAQCWSMHCQLACIMSEKAQAATMLVIGLPL